MTTPAPPLIVLQTDPSSFWWAGWTRPKLAEPDSGGQLVGSLNLSGWADGGQLVDRGWWARCRSYAGPWWASSADGGQGSVKLTSGLSEAKLSTLSTLPTKNQTPVCKNRPTCPRSCPRAGRDRVCVMCVGTLQKAVCPLLESDREKGR